MQEFLHGHVRKGEHPYIRTSGPKPGAPSTSSSWQSILVYLTAVCTLLPPVRMAHVSYFWFSLALSLRPRCCKQSIVIAFQFLARVRQVQGFRTRLVV